MELGWELNQKCAKCGSTCYSRTSQNKIKRIGKPQRWCRKCLLKLWIHQKKQKIALYRREQKELEEELKEYEAEVKTHG